MLDACVPQSGIQAEASGGLRFPAASVLGLQAAASPYVLTRPFLCAVCPWGLCASGSPFPRTPVRPNVGHPDVLILT